MYYDSSTKMSVFGLKIPSSLLPSLFSPSPSLSFSVSPSSCSLFPSPFLSLQLSLQGLYMPSLGATWDYTHELLCFSDFFF